MRSGTIRKSISCSACSSRSFSTSRASTGPSTWSSRRSTRDWFSSAFSITPVESIVSIFLQAFSRRNEYEADRYAAETFEQPEAMVSALKKLAVDHLANLTPHPLHVALNDSHPPILQRIRAIRQVEARPHQSSQSFEKA